ncbi:hypothetical protein ACFQV2_23220 [Actinokineospora soli]|uniref:Uncharacterized protein n=1 Tax=Actinokineospora soli TaxID=1048753 RepID=A0ABW2TR24_9PSEU
MTYGQDQYPHTAYQGVATPPSGRAYGEPRRKSGRGGVIALVVALVLAVVGAGVFGALWFVETGEHTTTKESLTRSQQKVAETEDSLAKADEAKRVAETKVGELTKCQEAGRDLLDSLDADDSEAERDKTTDALDRMDSFC